MRMRKALARILVVVLIFSVVAPASQIVVESAGAVSVQVPKYWMDFEDNLNVMTNGAEPVEAQMKVFKMEADYTGEAEFVEDAERGKVLRLGEYGFDLPHLSLDDSYSVSLWVKQEQHMGWASPIFYIRNISDGENYLALSSRNNQREYLLWNQLHPELYPTYELNRWSQYTISVEGKAIALYKDGTLVGTSTRDSIISSDNGMNIAFGVNIWDAIMKACIDDVKIYDKALTAEEARILFSGTPSVQINGSKPEIRVGEKLSLDADAFGVDSADGITLRWSSTNNAVAKIVNGVVTGISEGSASVSAALMKGENEIARDTFDINVVTSAGNYITPKYEMSLEGDLAVTGGLEPKLVTFGGSLPSYEGDAEYIDGIDGQAINLAGKYGFILENVAVDSTYTVSFYGKSNSRMQNHRPVCFISSDRGCSNWVALAGKDEGDGTFPDSFPL